jgi:predicted O-methyltransferase YrrM
LRSWNHQVEFTSDWFSINISSWIRHVPVLFCKTGLRVLEIGSYEGRSALWMANRVVRGAEARIDCVDTWEGSVEHSIHGETLKSRFMKNLAPFLGKTVFMHQGASKDVLVKMLAEGGGKYDVAYVDASHFAKDCLVDMVLAYELLKVGGYMIVDDYCEHPVMERHWYPKMAVDAFVAIYKDRMVKVNQNNQFILKKICDSSLYERERL